MQMEGDIRSNSSDISDDASIDLTANNSANNVKQPSTKQNSGQKQH